jgi:PAT family beta-lactamase induction signal transducer AmpG
MPSLLSQILSWRMLVVLLMGFSSGLPLLLIGGTLKAWLRQEGVDLTTIGFFSLAGLPYTIKFLWAPLMDRYKVLGRGRRRGWLLVCQLALMIGFAAMAVSNPAASLQTIGIIAVLIGFFSASQDIAVDAYRREVLRDEELGFGSSLAINGYRVAIYVSGALALILAGMFSWETTYLLMAGFMLVGFITTVFAPEPEAEEEPRSLREAVAGPFQDFFSRKGAFTILAFILLYKIGDSMASEMMNPFYIDLGFTLEQIGAVAKTLALVGTFGGAALGGLLMIKIGIARSLWVFGFLQAVSTMCFVLLSQLGASIPMLAVVIGFETFSGGMGTAAYVGYMASITNRRFTATQYALLTSLMGVPRVIFGAGTGWLAEQLGWQGFFVFCTIVAVPGLLLLFKIAPWGSPPPSTEPPVQA